MKDYDGVDEKLTRELYAEPALVPASPWLGEEKPGRAEAAVDESGGVKMLRFTLADGKKPWLWVVRELHIHGWETVIVPGEKASYDLKSAKDTTAMVVSGMSRLGQEGPATTVKLP
ncbi:MAG TPA: hypothetical protein VHU84_18540 [Lacipirellulaceae bacterium]|nr:hypothetical protein [Lacipirellulaceae bacterium]